MGLSGLISPCLAAHSSLLSASPPGQDLQVLRPVPSHWLRSPGLPAGVHLQPPLQPQPSGDFSHFHSGYAMRSPINARCDLPLSALVPFHLLGNHSPKAWRTQAVSLKTLGLRNRRGNAESLSWARGAARGSMGGPRSLDGGVPTVPATPSLSPRGLGQKHPVPRSGGDAASWHQAAAVRRGRESPRAAGSVEREWPHGDPSLLQIFAPGAEGRGPPRPYFRERRHRPLRARVCRVPRQLSSVHAAPPATAARSPVWAREPARHRPAARAATVASPGGGARGVQGRRGPWTASGCGSPAQALAAGGARGASLLQLPGRLAQRAASAGRGAGGPRVGECGATHRGTRLTVRARRWTVTPGCARLPAQRLICRGRCGAHDARGDPSWAAPRKCPRAWKGPFAVQRPQKSGSLLPAFMRP